MTRKSPAELARGELPPEAKAGQHQDLQQQQQRERGETRHPAGQVRSRRGAGATCSRACILFWHRTRRAVRYIDVALFAYSCTVQLYRDRAAVKP